MMNHHDHDHQEKHPHSLDGVIDEDTHLYR